MKVVRTIDELRSLRPSWGSVGFVPTMGAFHEGHLSLMRQAKSENDICVVSLFVNPTQFGPNEDLSKYPRQEETDIALATSAGADIMFAPNSDEVYPRKTTTVRVAELSEAFEGSIRPHHFEGVATVVLKLFNIVQPSTAYFGLKDLQQCAVIRRMVEDLNVPVKLAMCETVREPSGLAMSSRNAYLSATDRARAAVLSLVLFESARDIAEGKPAKDVLAKGKAQLESLDFVVEYLSHIDAGTMQEIEMPVSESRIVVATRFCGVRLIDNVPILSQPADKTR